MPYLIRIWLQWGCLLLLAACDHVENSTYEPHLADENRRAVVEYAVAIHPLHNPQRLMAIYGPIVEYIDARIPEVRFRLEASRNYAEFDKKLYAGQFAFAMPNPYQSVRSLKFGYRIFGKMADDDDFRGILLVRKDSGIEVVSDLKGKVVAYPAATALAATMMPQYYLHTHGIDIHHDIENRYVGSQESSIMNVLRGHVAAGATWPVPWKIFTAEHPELAAQLTVKWRTEPLLNNGWVVRKDIPSDVADRFADLLFALHHSEEGRAMLDKIPVSRFEPATDQTYRPVDEFLRRFSVTVRPIDY